MASGHPWLHDHRFNFPISPSLSHNDLPFHDSSESDNEMSNDLEFELFDANELHTMSDLTSNSFSNTNSNLNSDGPIIQQKHKHEPEPDPPASTRSPPPAPAPSTRSPADLGQSVLHHLVVQPRKTKTLYESTMTQTPPPPSQQQHSGKTLQQQYNKTPILTGAEVALQQQMVDVCRSIGPTTEEVKARAKIITKIIQKVREKMPHAQVHVVGSCATNLFLKESDIDMVVIHTEQKKENQIKDMFELGEHLRVLSETLQTITTAAVPVIKFEEQNSGYGVDITINVRSGIESTKMVQTYLEQFPVIRSMCVVLKQYLRNVGLNDLYTGGLPSFSLILMIVSFLQFYHPEIRKQVDEKDIQKITLADEWLQRPHEDYFAEALPPELGRYLLQFLEHYCSGFDYATLGISVEGNGHFFPKRARGWWHAHNPELLCIESPLDARTDLGFKTFRIRQVRQQFLIALDTLRRDPSSLRSSPPCNQRALVERGRSPYRQRQSLSRSSSTSSRSRRDTFPIQLQLHPIQQQSFAQPPVVDSVLTSHKLPSVMYVQPLTGIAPNSTAFPVTNEPLSAVSPSFPSFVARHPASLTISSPLQQFSSAEGAVPTTLPTPSQSPASVPMIYNSRPHLTNGLIQHPQPQFPAQASISQLQKSHSQLQSHSMPFVGSNATHAAQGMPYFVQQKPLLHPNQLPLQNASQSAQTGIGSVSNATDAK